MLNVAGSRNGGRHSRCRLIGVAAIVAGALLIGVVPEESRAARTRVVQSVLAHGGNVVSVEGATSRPYGLATFNGKRLQIECIKTGSALYLTYNPLFPVVYANYYAMRGRLPNGKRRWIIGAEFAPFTSLIVRERAGNGPCGTDELASANLAVGWVLLT